MFSAASASTIAQAISTSNLNFFTAIPGVGKKTAQRVILDLKSKISKGDVNLELLDGNPELVDSLVGLGFQKGEIARIVSQVDTTQDLSLQIKSALKLIAKK